MHMTSEHKNEYLFLSRTVKQKTTKQITIKLPFCTLVPYIKCFHKTLSRSKIPKSYCIDKVNNWHNIIRIVLKDNDENKEKC